MSCGSSYPRKSPWNTSRRACSSFRWKCHFSPAPHTFPLRCFWGGVGVRGCAGWVPAAPLPLPQRIVVAERVQPAEDLPDHADERPEDREIGRDLVQEGPPLSQALHDPLEAFLVGVPPDP